MNQKKLIFLHIPKTAGTTFREVLTQQFENDEITEIYGSADFDQELVSSLGNTSQRLILGHFGWKMNYHQYVEGNSWITFLREPISRTVSHFLHFKRSKDPRHIDLAEQYQSFPEFLTSKYANNWQCKRLGGGFYDESVSDKDCFKEALKNIDQRFEFVGVTEDFEKSLLLLAKKMKWRLPNYRSRNKNKQSSLADELRNEFGKEVLERNAWDQKLYEHAKNRLDQETQKLSFKLAFLMYRFRKS